jgi:5,10-methylenetetrahydromethanopterin reductase
MKRLFSGEELSYEGKCFRIKSVKLHNKPLRPDQPIFLGVKGDNGLAAAGEVADGVLLSAGSPLAYVSYAKDRVMSGAIKAGRDPKNIKIAAYLITCMDEDRLRARDIARPIAAHFLGLHGVMPIMTTSGLTPEEIAPFREAFLNGHEPKAEVTDKMLDAVVIAGTPSECREKIASYIDAGVDMPIVFEAAGAAPIEERFAKMIECLFV